MVEQWNAYTKDGKQTDIILIRDRVIPSGLYHMVCEVMVFHQDGSILCMKRDSRKKAYPGYYEASAGGSALYQEDKWQCIQRELYEETGIFCDSFELVHTTVLEEEQSLFYSFVCIVDFNKDSIRLQEGETVAYQWMTKKEFQTFLNTDALVPTQKQRYSAYYQSIGLIV